MQGLVRRAELDVQCVLGLLIILINVFSSEVINRWIGHAIYLFIYAIWTKLDQLSLPRQASMHLNSGLSKNQDNAWTSTRMVR